jgi:type IV secretory pathway VirB2 component (pilin)
MHQLTTPHHIVATLHVIAFYLQGTVPGQGFLNSISQFIVGPFGKAITLIAIVLAGVSYMYGKQSDNSVIARLAIGAILVVGAANLFAYIQAQG